MLPPLLHTADAVCRAVPALDRPLDAKALIAAAQRRAGVFAQPDASIRPALDAFISAVENEADLCLFGRLATRWDIVRLLVNLLRLQDEEAANPAILREPVERPIFITGLPRSGTTFLHGLLAEDPAALAPRCWQVIHPYPPRTGPDRRLALVQDSLDLFKAFAPAFAGVHPLDAGSPQECTDIMAHVFCSLRLDTTYTVPSYRRWAEHAGLEQGYRFHKRFLQHLQYQSRRSGRHWVLKCPDHVFGLDAIRAVYPDALIVFVHRDPVHVLASVAYLTEVLRQPFTRHLDRRSIGREVAAVWERAAGLIVADSAAHPQAAMHVRFDDLVAKPMAIVRGIADRAGRRLSGAAEVQMRHHLAAQPDAGYRHASYHLADYGLDADEQRRRFAPYIARFCSASPQTSSPSPARGRGPG